MDPATTYIYMYGHTLSLPVACPISSSLRTIRRPKAEPVCSKFSWSQFCELVTILRLPGADNRAAILPAPIYTASKAVAAESRSYSGTRSEEHTSELQSLMRISYAVFCLKTKIITQHKLISKT